MATTGTGKKKAGAKGASAGGTFVALLRGINVGGGNRVEMGKLRAAFEGLGFGEVKTYINSGNVIFKAAEKDAARLAARIEKAIRKDFGLDIKAVVLSRSSFKKIHDAAEDAWTNGGDLKTDVMFLWPEADRKSVLGELKVNPGVDTVRYVRGAVLWHIRRKDFSKSGMSKLVGTALYRQMTIRNVNTLRKLGILMGE